MRHINIPASRDRRPPAAPLLLPLSLITVAIQARILNGGLLLATGLMRRLKPCYIRMLQRRTRRRPEAARLCSQERRPADIRQETCPALMFQSASKLPDMGARKS
jgi:hypothetical protein